MSFVEVNNFCYLIEFKVNENGEATDKKSVVALSGYIRAKGKGDKAITQLLKGKNILPIE